MDFLDSPNGSQDGPLETRRRKKKPYRQVAGTTLNKTGLRDGRECVRGRLFSAGHSDQELHGYTQDRSAMASSCHRSRSQLRECRGSLLSDGSPVADAFPAHHRGIREKKTETAELFFLQGASAWIITFCPTESLSTSRSSTSALMCRVEVSARLNNGRGSDGAKGFATLRIDPQNRFHRWGATMEHFAIAFLGCLHTAFRRKHIGRQLRAVSSCKGGAETNSSLRRAARRLASATPRSRMA